MCFSSLVLLNFQELFAADQQKSRKVWHFLEPTTTSFKSNYGDKKNGLGWHGMARIRASYFFFFLIIE
jgi:hypothetical protein